MLAWLYTVARRRLADEARRAARGPGALVSLEDARAELVGRVDYGAAVAGALRAAIERLPERQRSVLVLKLLRGAPFEEIARRLGTTQPACKMRFARALQALRDDLEREGISP